MSTVLVTRAAPDAATWTRELQARGVTAQVLPLLVIAAAPDPQALAHAWERLPSLAALMFVSGNAAHAFFAAAPEAALQTWIGQAQPPRAWATGPGTVAALRAHRLPDALIDAPSLEAPRLDSEALWEQVGLQLRPGQQVLIVRGADTTGAPTGRGWLAARLRASGATVHEVAAYTRMAPAWDATERGRATQAASDGSWWLFSSSEAIGQLRKLLPAQPWTQARALATHPRIAQAAREAGFGQVHEVAASLDGVAAFLQSPP